MTMKLIAESNGFDYIREEDLPEIEGTAHIMKHRASGARLLFLQNDDPNKAFSIGFKTLPVDDTGVFHILEHSVLCGSDKFPVKEPFVNLLKNSMQTFLNAMTFPDKTIYPVSSTNEQDLENLMDVYMDAVLHPAIYDKPQIFQQEGWHLETKRAASPVGAAGDVTDDAGVPAEAPEAPGLAFNGVVFNEMKGALSNPESVIYDALSANLFPDTAYRFESGGTPEAIVKLTYEQFLDTHSRHYRLDNSYIMLYGNLDPQRFLQFLDKRYLTPDAQLHHEAGAPNVMELQAPVTCTHAVKTMDTSAENAGAALGYVVGDATERTKLVAVDILLDAIAGSNEAPLKAAVLAADVVDDFEATLADAVLQPFAFLYGRGLHEGCYDRLCETVKTELQRLAEGGLDRSLVDAALSHEEFTLREGASTNDGINFAMTSLTSWLYDDEHVTDFIRFEDVFAELHKKLDEGYFEELIHSVFLESQHFAGVELVAEKPANPQDNWEADALAKLSAGFDAEDYAAIDRDVELLRQHQEAPDRPEDVAKLPHLGIADLDEAPAIPDYSFDSSTPIPSIKHTLPTRGIVYVNRYYDLMSVAWEDLPYVSILVSMLGKIGTEKYTAYELDKLLQAKLGNLFFNTETYTDDVDHTQYRPQLLVASSALPENLEYLASVSDEVMHHTNFHDKERIRNALIQKRVAKEQAFLNGGHVLAISRVASYSSPSAAVFQNIGGIEGYLALKEIIDDFDNRFEALVAKLEELCATIFDDSRCVMSIAGPEDAQSAWWKLCPLYTSATDAATDASVADEATVADEAVTATSAARLVAPKPTVKNEAFIVPADGTFASLGFDARQLGGSYDSSWVLASRMLSYDYLWNEVRVKGGAYGAGLQARRTGSISFYSYRDPHLDETIERFARSASWLDSAAPDADEYEGYIVSIIAGLDSPMKAREMVRRLDGWYFSSLDAQDHNQLRQQVIDTSFEEVRGFSQLLEKAVNKDNRCVIGSRSTIEGSKLDWKVIELF